MLDQCNHAYHTFTSAFSDNYTLSPSCMSLRLYRHDQKCNVPNTVLYTYAYISHWSSVSGKNTSVYCIICHGNTLLVSVKLFFAAQVSWICFLYNGQRDHMIGTMTRPFTITSMHLKHWHWCSYHVYTLWSTMVIQCMPLKVKISPLTMNVLYKTVI